MGARFASAISLLLLFAPTAAAQSMAVALEAGDELGEGRVVLEDALSCAADELFADPVTGPEDVAEIGAEDADLADCSSPGCWSRVGRALEVDLVLVVRAVSARDKLLLSIRLVDVAAQRIVVRAQEPIANDFLSYASDCRTVIQSLRDELPAELRSTLRGAAPLAVAAPAAAPPPPPPPTQAPAPAAPVELAPSALDNPGWLGVKHNSIDFDTAERIGLSPPLGAVIEKVAPDGSAAAAGLRENDVVIDYGGHAVKSRVDLLRLVRRTRSGAVVPITVWRDGAAIVVPTTMVARGGPTPADATAAAPPPPPEPDEPRTVTKDELDISDSGFSYTHEEVTEVTEPVDSVTFVTWGLSGVYIGMEIDTGFGDPITSKAYGGGFALGFRYLDPLGDFPTRDDPSSSRHCVSLSANALLSVIRVSMDMDIAGVGDLSSSSTMAYLELGAMAGYTFLWFGSFDPETLEQSGFGITLGVQGGVTRMFSFEDSSAEYDFETYVRPGFGLEFPSYNPGTGSVSSTTVMAFIYPKSDMFTIVVAVGGSF